MLTEEPIICMRDVDKVFVAADITTRALSDIDLDVHRGEFVCISGPSGCGKSTLLSLLGLLDSPSSGTYRLKGTEVCDLSAQSRSQMRNREIGYVFQSFNLIGDLTAWENVELPLTYRGMPATVRREQVSAALESVGMAQHQRHYISQLSGGQQQRVAVARAIAGSPSILLADEPTGNLDSTNGHAVMNLLGELHREGATICMVTHDHHFASFADRKIHLLDGKIIAPDEADGQASGDETEGSHNSFS